MALSKGEKIVYRGVPLLIIWGVWFAINGAIFEDCFMPTYIYATSILALYEFLLKEEKDNNNKILNWVVIERSLPWDSMIGPLKETLWDVVEDLYFIFQIHILSI